jgi:hypothetical protein
VTSEPAAILGRRMWRRLERSALRHYRRDLHDQVRLLAATHPPVVQTTCSSTPAVVTIHLSDVTVVLAGVSPWSARFVVEMVHPATGLTLMGAGRYGRFWWLTLRGSTTHVILGTHLQLRRELGRTAAQSPPPAAHAAG